MFFRLLCGRDKVKDKQETRYNFHMRRLQTPFLGLHRQREFALHSFLLNIIQHTIGSLSGDGDCAGVLLTNGDAAMEGVIEFGGDTVRVSEGVTEIVFEDEGAAVIDLDRDVEGDFEQEFETDAVTERVNEIVVVTELEAEGVLT